MICIGAVWGTMVVRRCMTFEIRGETLSVVGVRELGADNSQAFREEVRAALPDKLKNIEIDLSQTSFLDSCGLGALISLRKTASSRNGKVRLLNPPLPSFIAATKTVPSGPPVI